jgi:hypothetical protein
MKDIEKTFKSLKDFLAHPLGQAEVSAPDNHLFNPELELKKEISLTPVEQMGSLLRKGYRGYSLSRIKFKLEPEDARDVFEVAPDGSASIKKPDGKTIEKFKYTAFFSQNSLPEDILYSDKFKQLIKNDGEYSKHAKATLTSARRAYIYERIISRTSSGPKNQEKDIIRFMFESVGIRDGRDSMKVKDFLAHYSARTSRHPDFGFIFRSAEARMMANKDLEEEKRKRDEGIVAVTFYVSPSSKTGLYEAIDALHQKEPSQPKQKLFVNDTVRGRYSIHGLHHQALKEHRYE